MEQHREQTGVVRNVADLIASVVRKDRDEDDDAAPGRVECLVCETSLVDSDVYEQHRVCPKCKFHYTMTARERVSSLVDRDTFQEINRSITSLDPLSFSSRTSYKRRIFRDQRRTGLTEAIVTGTCFIGGNEAMLIVLDFGFMGGTMGCVVGEKIALAFEQAARKKLPTVAIVTSGGARIQEGILSLMQMAKTSIAAGKLNDKGLPFISVLANPSTGEAYASFANMADVILAEPGAIVGFTPLRVMQESSKTPLPTEANTAESLAKHGLLDAVVGRLELRRLLSVLLDLLGPQYKLTPTQKLNRPRTESHRPEAWDSVQLARHQSRPSSVDYMSRMLTSFVEIHGDRSQGDDKSIVCGIGQLATQTVVVIGQERGRTSNERNNGRTSPEGFRKAQRALRLAAKFGIPVITLIDTPGPDESIEAELHGLGNAISSNISLMSSLSVPSIAVVIGEGGSAGALAFGVADRVLMLENAIYTTISPEDAAELIYRDEERADEAAESLRLTARDCLEFNIIDQIIPEPPGGSHTDPDEAARQLRRILIREIADLQAVSKHRNIARRYRKFRKMGEYSSRFGAAVTREVDALQGFVASNVRRITRRQRRPSDDEDWDVQALIESSEAGSQSDDL